MTYGTLLSSQGTGAHRFLALRPLAGHDLFCPFWRQKEKLRPQARFGQIALFLRLFCPSMFWREPKSNENPWFLGEISLLGLMLKSDFAAVYKSSRAKPLLQIILLLQPPNLAFLYAVPRICREADHLSKGQIPH